MIAGLVNLHPAPFGHSTLKWEDVDVTKAVKDTAGNCTHHDVGVWYYDAHTTQRCIHFVRCMYFKCHKQWTLTEDDRHWIYDEAAKTEKDFRVIAVDEARERWKTDEGKPGGDAEAHREGA